jgi:hypothetical protein
MPEKILAEVNEYYTLLLAINAISCLALLYILTRKINQYDKEMRRQQTAPVKQVPVKPVEPVKQVPVEPVEQVPVEPVEPVKPVKQVPVEPVEPVKQVPVKPVKPVKQVPVKPVKQKPLNLSWGISNNSSFNANACQPVYQVYSIY